MPLLEIRKITKSYQEQTLLDGISFEVENNETVCLLGPSGGGKSTILRIIAGLETAEKGQVIWQGKDISDVPPYARRFGLMFQDYALFPHLTVYENVAFGLRMQKQSEINIDASVIEALRLVTLDNFISRRVTDLSGGEQQRVALARALAPKPLLMMLDEPLGALDRTLREKLGEELRGLLRKMKIPAIYVTHDQQEAFSIADRILVLNQGRIIQSGKPSEVYSHPASPWLATFFGMDNQINGKIISLDPLMVATVIGDFKCDCQNSKFHLGEQVILVIKQTGAEMRNEFETKNMIEGRVIETIFSADRFKTKVAFKTNINFEFLLEKEYQTDQMIQLWIKPDSILCFGSKP
jgi:ABC-type Fe3+/spermidine/putrescine transport system ATPase subunit